MTHRKLQCSQIHSSVFSLFLYISVSPIYLHLHCFPFITCVGMKNKTLFFLFPISLGIKTIILSMFCYLFFAFKNYFNLLLLQIFNVSLLYAK